LSLQRTEALRFSVQAEHHKLTNKGSAKRPTSLNTNANNNHTMPKRPGRLSATACAGGRKSIKALFQKTRLSVSIEP